MVTTAVQSSGKVLTRPNTGAPNSFTNFKNAALQIGASLSSSATAASSTAPSGTATAAYGGVTVPPAVCYHLYVEYFDR